ncbi:MAG: EAL domain-containing protein, partial [Aeromonadaceae bacterium]
VKLDMELIRNIDRDPVRQVIVKNCIAMFNELRIMPLAEGVETREEMLFLRDCGVDLMQGYYFAHPGFESLPEVDFSVL